MTDVEIGEEMFLPKYRPMLYSDADINILWGGRDSGKTYFVASILIYHCLNDDYFKCILSRKIQDTIRGSQWQMIKDVVHAWGLQDEFDFVASPLEIRCKNGNKFIAMGADAKGKAKGVANPTHLWGEEWNQVTEAEYLVLSTTLRSNDVQVKEYWTFNPEAEGVADYTDFWIYKYTEDIYSDRIFNKTQIIDGEEVSTKFHIIHSIYEDNRFCPPSRKAKYLNAVEGSGYLYNVWINGYWGNKEVKNPFLTFFDVDKHVTETRFREASQIYVSIDFNIEPFCATIYNAWFEDGKPHLHQVDEVAIHDGTVEKMAEELKIILGRSIHSTMFGCDFMGTHGRIGRFDNASLKKDLVRALGISNGQFRTKPNPTHKSSANDCNYFLKHFPDFKVAKHCTGSIADYQTVEKDAYGHIIKRNRSDESQRADYLDTFRYVINTFFKPQIERHRKTGVWS